MSVSLTSTDGLDLFHLKDGYAAGRFVPRQVVEEVLRRIRERNSRAEWICMVPEDDVLARADELAAMDTSLPLYGVPFSVKDNIHVEGLPISAGCSAYQRLSTTTSPVVQRLLDLGAILIGKNTMDEFATGVVGVRSDPHPVSPLNPDYIPGGSSSGSGVVVSTGTVTFSLGSDTGGSGRLPAAMCNVVGFKPTPHLLSSEGMVYANRSIDCVPVFARTATEADYVFRQLMTDNHAGCLLDDLAPDLANLVIAIPDADGLKFFGDAEAEACFKALLTILEGKGARIQPIDFSVFAEAGAMLFDGAFISERFDSVGGFIKENPGTVNDVVAKSILKGETVTPRQIWSDVARLNQLKAIAHQLLVPFDCLLMPTAGTLYRCDEVKADPLTLNRNMAYYTNFGNLLDLSVVSVPGKIRADGLPFGLSFAGPRHSDYRMLALAKQWEQISGVKPGFTLSHEVVG